MHQLEKSESAEAIRRAEQRLLVVSVAQAYAQCRALPPICAMNPDPNPPRKSWRWSPDSAGFVIDCEHAVQKATEGKRDPAALYAAWERLQEDDAVIGADGARFIRAAAPVFAARKLHPRDYFRVDKYAHRRAGR